MSINNQNYCTCKQPEPEVYNEYGQSYCEICRHDIEMVDTGYEPEAEPEFEGISLSTELQPNN